MSRLGRFAGFGFGIGAALVLSAAPAFAGHDPGGGGLLPLAPLQQNYRPTAEKPVSRYPMNYSEEIAQSLGVRDGGVALTPDSPHSSHNSYMPSVSLGGGGSMLRLKWQP